MSQMTTICGLNSSVRGMLAGLVHLHKTWLNVGAVLFIPNVRSEAGTGTSRPFFPRLPRH